MSKKDKNKRKKNHKCNERDELIKQMPPRVRGRFDELQRQRAAVAFRDHAASYENKEITKVSVRRISNEGIKKLLKNEVDVPATCIIKVYANNCHLCHSLQEYYVDIAKSYEEVEGVYFYAFNIADNSKLPKLLNFHGTPTILAIQSKPDGPKRAKFWVLADPDKPNQKTWYSSSYMREFVEKVLK